MSNESESQPPEMLTIVTSSDVPDEWRRSDRTAEAARRVIEEAIPLETLRQNFDRFMVGLQKLVDVEKAQTGAFVLDEITFSAGISSNGEFKLFGSGFGVSATNAITFTLRRKGGDKSDGMDAAAVPGG